MTQPAFKELYELLTANTPISYMDIDKGQLDREKERIERYPAILWEWDGRYNTEGAGRRTASLSRMNLQAKLVFENMKRPDTYLNNIGSGSYLNEEGMNFLTIKETVRTTLHGYVGSYIRSLQVLAERLDTSFEGLTVIELDLIAEVINETACV